VHDHVQVVRDLRDPELQQRGQQVTDVVGKLGHADRVLRHVAEVRQQRVADEPRLLLEQVEPLAHR
jgi:hypothetical protein